MEPADGRCELPLVMKWLFRGLSRDVRESRNEVIEGGLPRVHNMLKSEDLIIE